ncbi:MAG: hypothetical protein B7733_10420 [Myxococcales bacterium FL481]|nr:MAG: hypothetical protein B7733_10420 [Myxococcales bacterium FL481]
MRANAVTSGAYLVSANRAPEEGTLIGGRSVAIGPDGETRLETEDALTYVDVDPGAVIHKRVASIRGISPSQVMSTRRDGKAWHLSGPSPLGVRN